MRSVEHEGRCRCRIPNDCCSPPAFGLLALQWSVAPPKCESAWLLATRRTVIRMVLRDALELSRPACR
jgi:hypothetical protein